jgi:hypothetical protein
MKRIITPMLILACFSAFAEDSPKTKQPTTDDVMAMYAEMGKPVSEHRRLESFTGTWRVTAKMWFGPGEPPKVSTGTATGRLILGGRFLQIDATTKGVFASDSLTLMGFDRRTNDYTMVGYDTHGTYYITAAGKESADKSIVLNGSYLQPPHGGEQKYRFVWSAPSPDRHLMTLFFGLPDGKEMLVAEMSYERAK